MNVSFNNEVNFTSGQPELRALVQLKTPFFAGSGGATA
jgi:hypothetical protein